MRTTKTLQGIKEREDQDAYRHGGHSPEGIGRALDFGVDFNKLYHQDSGDEADEHRAGISHKYPGWCDVVAQEGNGGSCQRKSNDRKVRPVNKKKPGAQGDRNQGGQTTCQPIDAIDEVKCIDDHQDRKHGQQDGSNLRHRVHAKDAIQAGQPYLCLKDQYETGKNLTQQSSGMETSAGYHPWPRSGR